jgi:hypothetical protein
MRDQVRRRIASPMLAVWKWLDSTTNSKLI